MVLELLVLFSLAEPQKGFRQSTFRIEDKGGPLLVTEVGDRAVAVGQSGSRGVKVISFAGIQRREHNLVATVPLDVAGEDGALGSTTEGKAFKVMPKDDAYELAEIDFKKLRFVEVARLPRDFEAGVAGFIHDSGDKITLNAPVGWKFFRGVGPPFAVTTGIRGGWIGGAANYSGETEKGAIEDRYRPVLWNLQGQPHLLTLPAGYASGYVSGINDKGLAVGVACREGGVSPFIGWPGGDSTIWHPVLWRLDRKPRVLTPTGKHVSVEALSINAKGLIGGFRSVRDPDSFEAQEDFYGQEGVLWQNNAWQKVVPPRDFPTGVKLHRVLHVLSSGALIVYGHDKALREGGFFLIVP